MKSNKFYLRLIVVLSVVIPVLVALLLYTPLNLGLQGAWVKQLPRLNAILNSSTAVCLILALVAIRRGNVTVHKKLMLTGLVLGTLFLVSYVIYHANSSHVYFGDANHDGLVDTDELLEVGATRAMYVFTLLSHIVLSIAVVPLVLMAFYFALTDQISKHKRVVKFTFPIWLYVSITGVIVYLMISPYYL